MLYAMRASIMSLTLFVCALSSFGQSCPLGLSGTFSVGPTGQYASLQKAMDALHQNGVTGSVILELQSGYSSSVESFPVTFRSVPCAGREKTVTVRLAAGAGRVTLGGNSPGSTIFFDSASYIMLDGRPGGVGQTGNLLVSNSGNAGTESTIDVGSGSSYNTIRFLDVQGANNTIAKGIISIGADVYSQGACSYNRVDSCNIGGGSGFSAAGVRLTGGVYSVNTGNVVNGCNIFNVYAQPPAVTNGILVELGNDSVQITNNNIYMTQEGSLRFPDDRITWYGIQVNTPYNGKQLIKGNYIGGSAALASGAPMTLTRCAEWRGILVCGKDGAAMADKINENHITNVNVLNANGTYAMIQLGSEGGKFFNGDCKGNVLGNTGADHTVNVSNPATAYNNFFLAGFYVFDISGDRVNITDNKINGFAASGSINFSGQIAGIYGGSIFFTGTDLNISNNTIGDPDLHNGDGFSANGRLFDCGGIYLAGVSPLNSSVVIAGNEISNIGAGINTYGIWYYSHVNGVVRIDSNKIHDLYTTNGGDPDPRQLDGILIWLGPELSNGSFGSNGVLRCAGNSIYSLRAMSGSIDAINIQTLDNSPAFHYEISRNKIQGLYPDRPAGFTNLADIAGLRIHMDKVGRSTFDNNMIQLGFDNQGSLITDGYFVSGILDYGGNHDFIHNSIYLDYEVPGTNLVACYSGNPLDTGFTPRLVNNIFSYRGSVSYSKPTVYAYFTGMPKTLSDYNVFSLSGPGTGLGQIFGQQPIVGDSLKQWQSLSGLDLHSRSADPLFKHPVGDIAAMDLHISPGSPAANVGTNTLTTALDFDGDQRSTQFVDIGADAINILPHDTVAPVVGDTTGTIRPYPNPFTDRFTLQLEGSRAGVATIVIYTLMGTPVLTYVVNLQPGLNSIPINMSNLPADYYVCRVEMEGRRQSVTLLKR